MLQRQDSKADGVGRIGAHLCWDTLKVWASLCIGVHAAEARQQGNTAGKVDWTGVEHGTPYVNVVERYGSHKGVHAAEAGQQGVEEGGKGGKEQAQHRMHTCKAHWHQGPGHIYGKRCSAAQTAQSCEWASPCCAGEGRGIRGITV
jgi:hypothetical protein